MTLSVIDNLIRFFNFMFCMIFTCQFSGMLQLSSFFPIRNKELYALCRGVVRVVTGFDVFPLCGSVFLFLDGLDEKQICDLT